MNQKTMLIGAVVIFVLIGMVLYSSGFLSANDNEFDLPGDDDNLQMKSKIDLALLFEDGSRKTVTGSTGDTLAVEYEGVEVTQVEWSMSFQANTPSGREPYNTVKVTTTPTLCPDYVGTADEDMYLRFECWNGPIGLDEYLMWEYESHNNVERTYTITPDSGIWNECFSETIQMADVFSSSDDAGTYTFSFLPNGYVGYRGESQYGNGDWQNVDMTEQGMGATYSIDFINEEATIDFDSEVIWS